MENVCGQLQFDQVTVKKNPVKNAVKIIHNTEL